MSLIVADSVSQIFGVNEVLKNVSFRLAADSRIGLVGPNGGGKTTLLRILAGELTPTEGRLQRAGALRIGYLPQEPPAGQDVSLHQAMHEVFDDVRKMEHELGQLAARLDGDQARLARYGRLQAAFDARGGYDYVRRIETVLTGLAFSPDQWRQPLAHLSGGQRTRACLAKLLLTRPDVLLLDEPTNHLDLESTEWLERWLQSFSGALVVVAHDRYFLDRATSSTWEVAFGAMERYRGPYSQYLPKRDERYDERLRQWQGQQKYIAETEDFIRRYHAAQRGKEARGRRTLLERFLKTEAMPKPQKHKRIHISFAGTERSGEMVLRAENLQIGYDPDNPLLAVEHLEVRRAQRIAVVGANGTGKTTLLRTLLGLLDPLAGTVRHGSNTQIGYLTQTHEDLRPDATALGALQAATGLKEAPARDLLGSLLLSGDDVFKRVDELSGGQRSRVLLAQLIAQNANVLLLDEPTNHLDIPSQEILQTVLQQFAGTVIFVSHDRYLIESLATDIWAIDSSGIKPLPGKWESYVSWRSGSRGEEPRADRIAAAPAAKDTYRQRRRRQNRLRRLQRQVTQAEDLIHALEAELKQLHDDISTAGQDGDLELITSLGEQYNDKHAKLRTVNRQWEQLSEELEESS